MRGQLNLIIVLACLVSGLILGSVTSAVAAPQGDIWHLIVERTSPGSPAAIRSEYWLDETRKLGVSVEDDLRRASGPNWLLSVPSDAARPVLRYAFERTIAPTGVLHQLWYFRYALDGGLAQITGRFSESITVRDIRGRTAELDTKDLMPIWTEIEGVRTNYKYPVRERLPVANFPAALLLAPTGRDSVSTTETDWAGVRARSRFTPAFAGPEVLGRTLRVAIHVSDPAGRSPERVTLLYGDDIQIVTSRLARIPAFARPGATSIDTPLGPGRLFDDGGRAQITIVRGMEAIELFAPDQVTALELSRKLEPNR